MLSFLLLSHHTRKLMNFNKELALLVVSSTEILSMHV